MMYRRMVLFGFLLCIMLGPLYLVYRHFADIIRQTGVYHPDVLLVTIDTCHYGSLGPYGNAQVYTPFINRLAQHGVVFPRGYAPIPTTGPSHTTLLTGRSPGAHRVFRNAMRYSGGHVTLAQLMRDSGYATAAFVSGYSLTARTSGLDVGFDVYDDAWSQTRLERDASEAVDACSAWMTQAHDHPVFCWLHLFDPHAPYQERDPIIEAIRPDGPHETVVVNYTPDQVKRYEEHARNAMESKDFMVLVKQPTALTTDPETLARNWTAYLSEISYTDHHLHRLYRRLETAGRWSRTAVFLTADHGEGFDHDYYYDHGDRLWESAVRVPWIIRLPFDEIKGRIARSVIRHEDVFPTIRSLCHIPLPVPNLEGFDMINTMRINVSGMTATWTAMAPPLPREATSNGLLLAAYDPNFKLIRTVETGGEAMYMLRDDPGERVDVGDRFPEIRKILSRRLDRVVQEARPPRSASMTQDELREEAALKALGYIH
ncbi:sulfatase [bacterium]|nr:sulfatase [candidate division CSSED10-310 bacterium]